MFDWSTVALVGAAALGTSFLSGVFGMIGGLVLMGVLLLFLPVPAAMTLHAITQMTANGWRAVVWREHILWRVLPGYLLGSAAVFAVLAVVQFSPPKPWVYLCLGIMPFAARALPRQHAPEIRRRGAPVAVGAMVMTLHVLAGVSGAILDMFFLAKDLDRRLVVSTKAMTQSVGHAIKFAYFTLIAAIPAQAATSSAPDAAPAGVPVWLFLVSAALAVCGTTLAKPVLHRFSNESFQTWSRRLVLGIGAVYLAQGIAGLLP
ncbi:MAG TPA: sulfite exporter TauE/SafE family protein [Alphaproteobacteria bacterium]|nr:sulfite exporter TauE/SafE family protein [Alphaproteobacteria bacterium]